MSDVDLPHIVGIDPHLVRPFHYYHRCYCTIAGTNQQAQRTLLLLSGIGGITDLEFGGGVRRGHPTSEAGDNNIRARTRGPAPSGEEAGSEAI